MLLAQCRDMIDALANGSFRSASRQNNSSTAAWRNRLVADAHGSQPVRDSNAVGSILVADQVARSLIPREGRSLAARPSSLTLSNLSPDQYGRSSRCTHRPTSFRSPWQNGHVERLIGSTRHECTDHVSYSAKRTFGAFCRSMPAIIMRYGRTFRLGRTRPARARSSGSETLSRNRSLVGCTIDMRVSDFSEGTTLTNNSLLMARTYLIFGDLECKLDMLNGGHRRPRVSSKCRRIRRSWSLSRITRPLSLWPWHDNGSVLPSDDARER